MAPFPQAPATCHLSDWLTLYHAPRVGAVLFHRLLERFENPASILGADADALASLGVARETIDAFRRPDQRAVERDLEWAQQTGNVVITCRDPSWPRLLSELPAAPPLLYVHGDASLLGEPQLAMVGSRNPTPAGHRTAGDFARHLAATGLVITSGLAFGIDAASHQGALDAGAPTIAVMGTGLDRVYPARHRDLARAIAENGALVSEFPTGTPPLAENFPRRNRIISGLSLGTLVVEAALRSGSLISARYAAEQGREVFAIPGSIHNTLARGCHALIRQGAKLVETAQDIIDELGPLAVACRPVARPDPAAPESPHQLAEDYQQLIEIIGFDNTSIDQLVAGSGLTPAEVSSMLLQLEMAGYVASSPGGIYNRLK
ncbi:MAG: DNA-processing protein DprA [Gammaproteobacteria bacterium]|jgi:DNA processing protein